MADAELIVSVPDGRNSAIVRMQVGISTGDLLNGSSIANTIYSPTQPLFFGSDRHHVAASSSTQARGTQILVCRP